MKRFLFVILSAAVCVAVSAKSAIVVAHYGSSDDVTRARTIDLITRDICHAFPGQEVRQAYISPVVRKALCARGIDIDSPLDALVKLCAEGYDTVCVQSTTLIEGSEMAEVRRAAERMAPFFKKISVGRPLLYTPDDCREVVQILLGEPCGKGEAVIYVGHGNMLPGTAAYCELDHMLGVASGTGGVYHVSTIEGYPTAQSTVAQLAGESTADGKVKSVKLVPLLLVCGNHTRHDIAGEYADVMRQQGYEVHVVMRGLGENPAVRDIYVKRVRDCMNSLSQI